MLAQQLVNALSLGCVYALFALGFTLVFGVLGVINLAHGAVFTVGAYAGLSLVTQAGLPLWAAVIGAFVLAGLTGLVMDLLILKRLRQREAPHLIPMIATIGAGMAITNLVQGYFGAHNLRFPASAATETTLTLGGTVITAIELGVILLSFVLMALLLAGVQRTAFGRALRAIAESPKAAHLLGVPVERLLLATSFLAAGLGGVAGVLIGVYANAVFPMMGQGILHKGIAVIILGGMGDMRGAMLAGLFLGLAEVFCVAYIGSPMRDAVAFGLLFLILLVRPTGLFGKMQERKA